MKTSVTRTPPHPQKGSGAIKIKGIILIASFSVPLGLALAANSLPKGLPDLSAGQSITHGIVQIPSRIQNGLTHIGQAAAIFYEAAFLGEEFDLSNNLVGQTFGIGLNTAKATKATNQITQKSEPKAFCKTLWGISDSDSRSINLQLGTSEDIKIQTVPRGSDFKYEFRVHQTGTNAVVKIAQFDSEETAQTYLNENQSIYGKLRSEIKMVSTAQVNDIRIIGQGKANQSKTDFVLNRLKLKQYDCPNLNDKQQPTKQEVAILTQ